MKDVTQVNFKKNSLTSIQIITPLTNLYRYPVVYETSVKLLKMTVYHKRVYYLKIKKLQLKLFFLKKEL
jgi:hypothetical protein